jgi:hypothetical protein
MRNSRLIVFIKYNSDDEIKGSAMGEEFGRCGRENKCIWG